jgi:hypothetical protein
MMENRPLDISPQPNAARSLSVAHESGVETAKEFSGSQSIQAGIRKVILKGKRPRQLNGSTPSRH